MAVDMQAMFKLSHGIYVIGVNDDQGRNCGCIVDALLQATTTPFGIEVCTNKNSYTSACISQSREFTISVLGVSADPKVIAKFGLNSSRDIANKWDGVDHVMLNGIPVLADCLSQIRVKVFHKLELSTHYLWSCEVLDAIDVKSGTPLTYGFYREYLGALVKQAQDGKDVKPLEDKGYGYVPTASVENKVESNAPKHVCGVCGYTYEGDVPFEDLPDDWVCPHCGMAKEVFS